MRTAATRRVRITLPRRSLHARSLFRLIPPQPQRSDLFFVLMCLRDVSRSRSQCHPTHSARGQYLSTARPRTKREADQTV